MMLRCNTLLLPLALLCFVAFVQGVSIAKPQTDVETHERDGDNAIAPAIPGDMEEKHERTRRWFFYNFYNYAYPYFYYPFAFYGKRNAGDMPMPNDPPSDVIDKMNERDIEPETLFEHVRNRRSIDDVHNESDQLEDMKKTATDVEETHDRERRWWYYYVNPYYVYRPFVYYPYYRFPYYWGKRDVTAQPQLEKPNTGAQPLKEVN